MAAPSKEQRKAISRGEVGTLKSDIRVHRVPNPFYSPDHSGESWNPPKIKAYVNIKESAVGTLYSRGHINDAQWAAAGRFRQYWERSGAKGTVAIDYGRAQVDGGKSIDPLPDSMIDAVQRLNECKPVLGRKVFDLMIKVVGQGMEIKDLAANHRERTTLGDYLKDGLDELAVHWGYRTQ